MRLLLVRDTFDRDFTLGKLHVDNEIFDTIERPWKPAEKAKGGAKGVSCVPLATYRLFTHDSEAHPRTWALCNPNVDVYHWDNDVPPEKRGLARTVVLIHVANWASELRGCIAPGLRRGADMVERSAAAMHRIQSILPWTADHELKIVHESTRGNA